MVQSVMRALPAGYKYPSASFVMIYFGRVSGNFAIITRASGFRGEHRADDYWRDDAKSRPQISKRVMTTTTYPRGIRFDLPRVIASAIGAAGEK